MKIRLAFREEGNFWNAYLALSDTMEGAKLIGSISIGAVYKDKKVKDDFMKVMQRVLANAIKDTTGVKPRNWETIQAPKRERSGHS
jgi:hypothetical protein